MVASHIPPAGRGGGIAIDILPPAPGVLGELDEMARRMTAALAPPAHPPVLFGCTCPVCNWLYRGRREQAF